jgi:hypothetical protein
VAVALEVADHRHARFLLHTLDEAAPAARHENIDRVRHAGEHMAHRGSIRRRHDLDRGLRQPGGAQPRDQACMNCTARLHAFGAAAQDHRVARFQTQRARVRSHVRATLVDDADHAERHPHALDAQPVGPRPGCNDDADRIGQRRDVFDAARHRRNPFLVERQAIQHRRRKLALRRRLQIAAIGFEDRVALLANLRRGRSER